VSRHSLLGRLDNNVDRCSRLLRLLVRLLDALNCCVGLDDTSESSPSLTISCHFSFLYLSFSLSNVTAPSTTTRVDPNVVQEIRNKKTYFSNRVEEIRQQALLRSKGMANMSQYATASASTKNVSPRTSVAQRATTSSYRGGNNYFQSRIEDCRKGTLLRNIEAAKAARGVKSTVGALKDVSSKTRTANKNKFSPSTRKSLSSPTLYSGDRQYAAAPPRRPPPRRIPPPPRQRFNLDENFTYPNTLTTPSTPAAARPSVSSTRMNKDNYPYPRLVEPARTYRYQPPTVPKLTMDLLKPLMVGRGSSSLPSSAPLDLYKPEWGHCDTRWY
jgi:hypothetical protein